LLTGRRCLVNSLYCGISAGTERLAFNGQIQVGILLDESIPELMQKAVSPYPYGYCLVGEVQECAHDQDKSLKGKRVLAFHPHQTRICVESSRLIPLPEFPDKRTGVLLPNMETAVNLVLDGAPLLGEKAGLVGLGLVGRLSLHLLRQFPLAELHVLEISDSKIQVVEDKTALIFNEAKEGSLDLVFELSGNPAGLQKAIDLCAYDGRIIVGSWYGSKNVSLNLGSDFHRKRLKIVSSQVSSIAPLLRGRWDFARRMKTACRHLENLRIEDMITHIIPFSRAIEAYNLISEPGETYLQIVLDMQS